MYEELKVIVRGLFEMHMMQDKIVAKNTKTKSYNRIKNEIDSSISAFDSKINIEKLNLKKSDFISGR